MPGIDTVPRTGGDQRTRDAVIARRSQRTVGSSLVIEFDLDRLPVGIANDVVIRHHDARSGEKTGALPRAVNHYATDTVLHACHAVAPLAGFFELDRGTGDLLERVAGDLTLRRP